MSALFRKTRTIHTKTAFFLFDGNVDLRILWVNKEINFLDVFVYQCVRSTMKNSGIASNKNRDKGIAKKQITLSNHMKQKSGTKILQKNNKR